MRGPLQPDELVEQLLLRVLGECIEVELLAADSQFESQAVFRLLNSLKIGPIIAWRRLKSRESPPDVLTVKDRIDVEGPEWKKRYTSGCGLLWRGSTAGRRAGSLISG